MNIKYTLMEYIKKELNEQNKRINMNYKIGK